MSILDFRGWVVIYGKLIIVTSYNQLQSTCEGSQRVALFVCVIIVAGVVSDIIGSQFLVIRWEEVITLMVSPHIVHAGAQGCPPARRACTGVRAGVCVRMCVRACTCAHTCVRVRACVRYIYTRRF
jgi:hypothetical protein